MFLCPTCARVFPAPGVCPSDGTPLLGDEPSLLGSTVGSYRVERLIGRGGMGEVYLGVQPEIGSRVAIKLLAGGAHQSPSLVERFFAEAKAVNVIRHEGIVNVLDLGRLGDGRPYIVMEYLEGAPLSEVIRRGPPPLGTLARIVLETLEALGAAHAAGITHRDLKPDNVFVTQLGRAKLLDFGIAKLKPELSLVGTATRTGALVGTPQYMSPEQARGQPVDARSDLYSVGVLLFEAATGRRPFDADALYDVLHLHLTAPPPRPSELRAEILPAYESVILRALEKDPARRFQSAAEFAAALDAAARFLPPAAFAPLSTVAVARAASLHPSPPVALTTAGTVSASTPTAFAPTLVALPKKRSLLLPLALGGGSALFAALALVLAAVSWPRSTPKPIPAASAAPFVAFDLTDRFPEARRLARGKIPDAELVTFASMAILSDGTTDPAGPGVTYTFRSAATAPAEGSPQPVVSECVVAVIMSPSGTRVMKLQGVCTSALAVPPRCRVARVVERAGVPPGAKVSVQFFGTPAGSGWMVVKSGKPVRIDDDC